MVNFHVFTHEMTSKRQRSHDVGQSRVPYAVGVVPRMPRMLWVCVANWLETVDVTQMVRVKAIRDALGYPNMPLELERCTVVLATSRAPGFVFVNAVRRHVRNMDMNLLGSAVLALENSRPFPRLQSLRLRLQSLCLRNRAIRQVFWDRLIAACPVLTKLRVESCAEIERVPFDSLVGHEWKELHMPNIPCTLEQMTALISPAMTHLVVDCTDREHQWTLPELEKVIAKWQGKSDRVRQLTLGGQLASHDVLLRAVEAFPNLEAWPWPHKEDWTHTLNRFQWPHPTVLQPLYSGWGFIDTFPPFADECNAYICDWIWLDVVRTSKRPLRKIRLLGSDVLSYDWKTQDIEALIQSTTSWESVFLHGSHHFTCSGAIVNHLVTCPRLRTMTLNLAMSLTDELLATMAAHPTLEEIYLDHYHTDPPRPTSTVKVESLEKLILGRKTVRLECCNLDGLGLTEHKRLQVAWPTAADCGRLRTALADSFVVLPTGDTSFVSRQSRLHLLDTSEGRRLFQRFVLAKWLDVCPSI